MKTKMNKIHNIDCLEFMKQVPDNYFDLVLTDPPYGINIAEWDCEIPPKEYFDEIFRISKHQIIFGGNYFELPHTNAWLCWDRVFAEDARDKAISQTRIPRENISDFEMIWTSLNIRPSFIRYTYVGNLKGFNNKLNVNYQQKEKIHPTQKPTELIEHIIREYSYYKNDDLKSIFDPFSGSGSTLVVAKTLGIDWCGCETIIEYLDKSIKRLEAVQGSLF
jgi:site-specific DNA-methyltransferase (adenine-specific)